MTLITYIVTVMKCVADATQTTDQRTRRNEGEHREWNTEGHAVRSIVANAFWVTDRKSMVCFGASHSKKHLTQDRDVWFVVICGGSNS